MSQKPVVFREVKNRAVVVTRERVRKMKLSATPERNGSFETGCYKRECGTEIFTEGDEEELIMCFYKPLDVKVEGNLGVRRIPKRRKRREGLGPERAY